MYILRGNIKDNIEKILSEEAEILNTNRRQKALFVQLCERSFTNLRDWFTNNREVLLSDSQIDYCGRIIRSAINTPKEKGDFIDFIDSLDRYSGKEELESLKQDDKFHKEFIAIARATRETFFQYLPINDSCEDISVVRSFKMSFSMGVSNSIEELSKHARKSGFRQYLDKGVSEPQTHLARVLQERDDNQQEKNQEGSFVAKVTRSHSKSYNKSSDISEEKMPR